MEEDFDRAVQRAKQEAGNVKPIQWKGVRCVPNTGRYEDTIEQWPTKFLIPPSVGDYVYSATGHRLVIISINHRVGALEVELGRQKRSDVTPTEGGAIPPPA